MTPRIEKAVARFADRVVRRRRLVVALGLLVCAAAIAGVARLGFDIDYRVYFSPDNPELRAFEALQDRYTKQDNILFVIVPEDGDALSPRMLDLIVRATDAAWQIPYARRVDSVTNFQYSYAEGDDLVVEDLVSDPLSLTPDEIARVRRIALSDPMLVDRLISPKGDVTGINVTLQLPGEDLTREVPRAVKAARALAARIEAENPGVSVRLTGGVMLNNAFPEASIHDLETLNPIMGAAIAFMLWLFLRSVVGVLATLAVTVLAAGSAMGLAGWAGLFLTPPSAAASIVILTVAVADCVHLFKTYQVQCRRGVAPHAALVESLRVNFEAVFITSLTTAVGFLSMNASDAPPLRDLGNIAAVGVAVAFVLSLTVFPAMLAMRPLRHAPVPERADGAMRALAEFVIARRKALLATAGVLVLALGSQIPKIELNDEFVAYFDESTAFRRDTDFATERLTGIYTLQYSLKSDGPGGINDPAYLATVEAFAEWFRAQPGVRHVSSIVDIVKRLNRNMHGDDPAFDRLPESRELTSQYLLLYELSLPLGLDLNDLITMDRDATRFLVVLDSLSTREIRALDRRAQDWLAAHAPPTMMTGGTSAVMMFAHISERNIKSMLGATGIAMVLIALCLAAVLRSVKFGLISLLPNAIPAVLAFGIWAIAVGQAGLAVSAITAMTLGIVVDDTVHFLSKYLRARREMRLPPADAVRHAFEIVGGALVTTSAVLIVGFLVLAQSSFRVNWEMGTLSALTIALALLADLLFLPPLVMATEGRDAAKAAAVPTTRSTTRV